MKKRIYGVRDKIVGSYISYVVFDNDRIAARNFELLARDENGVVGMYPNDFEMYCLGEVDPNTGCITSFDVPSYVCVASDFVKVGD